MKFIILLALTILVYQIVHCDIEIEEEFTSWLKKVPLKINEVMMEFNKLNNQRTEICSINLLKNERHLVYELIMKSSRHTNLFVHDTFSFLIQSCSLFVVFVDNIDLVSDIKIKHKHIS